MPIPLIKEPLDVLMPEICELCHFCRRPTRTWHQNTNNPVCEKCAPKHKVSELPDFGQVIRNRKRKERILRTLNPES